jgi:drug/metabolite transporter (DMT)-like permease
MGLEGPMSAMRRLDRIGTLVVLFTCLGLGFQQVAVKLALSDFSGLTQAALRSGGAIVPIAAYLYWTDPKSYQRDGTMIPGLIAALLFSLEFLALFVGLEWTDSGRAATFLYTHPFFTALGLVVLLPTERLGRLQWAGLVLSFIGVAIALGVSGFASAQMVRGDLLALFAGFTWAMTTLVVKTTCLRSANPLKVLLYQLVGSAVLLGIAAYVRGEHWPAHVSPQGIGSMAYQIFMSVVLCFSLWFWLISRYRAGEVAAFTFLTPVIGVGAGALLLGEPVAAGFAAAVGLVAAGILLVNWPGRAR